jgi:di/tricarboxylate transporter
MSDLAQADIFFFITSVVVIVFGVIIMVGSFYVLRILHSIRYIAKKIQQESDHVSEDIAELRGRIKEEGFRFGTIARTLVSFFVKKATSRRNKKTDN